jgi:hypothetical protein
VTEGSEAAKSNKDLLKIASSLDDLMKKESIDW